MERAKQQEANYDALKEELADTYASLKRCETVIAGLNATIAGNESAASVLEATARVESGQEVCGVLGCTQAEETVTAVASAQACAHGQLSAELQTSSRTRMLEEACSVLEQEKALMALEMAECKRAVTEQQAKISQLEQELQLAGGTSADSIVIAASAEVRKRYAAWR